MYTPEENHGWNMSSWSFGWDHFPVKNGWFVGSSMFPPLIFQASLGFDRFSQGCPPNFRLVAIRITRNSVAITRNSLSGGWSQMDQGKDVLRIILRRIILISYLTSMPYESDLPMVVLRSSNIELLVGGWTNPIWKNVRQIGSYHHIPKSGWK